MGSLEFTLCGLPIYSMLLSRLSWIRKLRVMMNYSIPSGMSTKNEILQLNSEHTNFSKMESSILLNLFKILIISKSQNQENNWRVN